MNEKQLFAEERQLKILSLLHIRKKITVNELCDIFSVSTTTIRTDLTRLEQNGSLKRTHGGAICTDGTSFELTFQEKEKVHLEEKIRIAELSQKLVQDGDTIAIDSGTTTRCFAEMLSGKKNLTVVTYDIKIADTLENFEGVTVILVGGYIRKGFNCCVGSFANYMLNLLNVDKTFIATNAVDANGFLSTPDIEQAEVKKSLIKNSHKTFLLCDSSKFNTTSFVNFSSIEDIHTVVTDSSIAKETIELLKNKNVRLYTV